MLALRLAVGGLLPTENYSMKTPPGPVAARKRIAGAFQVIQDRNTDWGSVRWFARKCGVNETTVWVWLRKGHMPASAQDKLTELERVARDAAHRRYERTLTDAAETLKESEALVG